MSIFDGNRVKRVKLIIVKIAEKCYNVTNNYKVVKVSENKSACPY